MAPAAVGCKPTSEAPLVLSGGFNQGLFMRTHFGIGTPRGLQGRLAPVVALLGALWTHVDSLCRTMRAPTTVNESAFIPHHHLELLLVSMSEVTL